MRRRLAPFVERRLQRRVGGGEKAFAQTRDNNEPAVAAAVAEGGELHRSALDDGDRAGPARRGPADLVREAGDGEAVARQGFQIVQLLQMAVADVAARLVPLPDQGGVAGLGDTLGG